MVANDTSYPRSWDGDPRDRPAAPRGGGPAAASRVRARGPRRQRAHREGRPRGRGLPDHRLPGLPGRRGVHDLRGAGRPTSPSSGVEASLANNEAQSAAMVNGARQVPGARAMAVFKSVGAYVALDALAIANAARPAEGAAGVVVVGDDPTLSSTQVGADSRLTLSGARIPVLEPSTAQEVKDFTRLAFELSARSGLIVGVVVTTVQADGAGVVDLAPNRAPAVGPHARVALDTAAIRAADAVSLPPFATSLEADLLERRLPLVTAAAAAGGADRLEPGRGGAHRFGIVVSGAAYPLLRYALADARARRGGPGAAARPHLPRRRRGGAPAGGPGGRGRGDGGAGRVPGGTGAGGPGGPPPGGLGEGLPGRGAGVPGGLGHGPGDRPGGPLPAGARPRPPRSRTSRPSGPAPPRSAATP